MSHIGSSLLYLLYLCYFAQGSALRTGEEILWEIVDAELKFQHVWTHSASDMSGKFTESSISV